MCVVYLIAVKDEASSNQSVISILCVHKECEFFKELVSVNKHCGNIYFIFVRRDTMTLQDYYVVEKNIAERRRKYVPNDICFLLTTDIIILYVQILRSRK